MKKLIFQVEFLSDIVLPASSNTEGNIRQLEFIPGSNFLGMVARKYDKFSNSFDVFHSGKVRFGDATLLVEGEEAYKMPFSFFHPKLEENRLFHHHFLDVEQRKELGQLKQMRSGYILPDVSQGIKVEHINYNYAQKSAYDAKNRRSKTSSMYGYRAIEKGTKWQFVVKYEEEGMNQKDIDCIIETLSNSTRLGKSKSAQYGQIEITKIGTTTNLSTEIKVGEEVVLYAKSRIALVDNEGNATYDLQYLFDGAKVLYDKCQIRTSTFTPYNRAMQTKTYERLVIEAGSVIVLESLSEEQKKLIEKGVGIYLAEGFGELMVNPAFLMEQNEMRLLKKSKTKAKTDQRKEIKDEIENDTVQFLVNRHNEEIKRLKLADEVQKFVDDNKALYRDIKNAQWGTIRSICTSNSETYIEDIKEYIESGKVSWKKEQIEALLPETSYSLEFIKLVAIQMPKEGDN